MGRGDLRRASRRRRELFGRCGATPQSAFATLPALAVSSRASRPSAVECRPPFRLESRAAILRLSRLSVAGPLRHHRRARRRARDASLLRREFARDSPVGRAPPVPRSPPRPPDLVDDWIGYAPVAEHALRGFVDTGL